MRALAASEPLIWIIHEVPLLDRKGTVKSVPFRSSYQTS
jgi:hypothetical protein